MQGTANKKKFQLNFVFVNTKEDIVLFIYFKEKQLAFLQCFCRMNQHFTISEKLKFSMRVPLCIGHASLGLKGHLKLPPESFKNDDWIPLHCLLHRRIFGSRFLELALHLTLSI